MATPSHQEVVDAVAEVVNDFDQVTSTPEGEAAVQAAVEYAAAEGHEE